MDKNEFLLKLKEAKTNEELKEAFDNFKFELVDPNNDIFQLAYGFEAEELEFVLGKYALMFDSDQSRYNAFLKGKNRIAIIDAIFALIDKLLLEAFNVCNKQDIKLNIENEELQTEINAFLHSLLKHFTDVEANKLSDVVEALYYTDEETRNKFVGMAMMLLPEFKASLCSEFKEKSNG